MNRVQVFVSYDAEHDRDLYERLLCQSRSPGSDFDVMGASEQRAPDETSATARSAIRGAEQVIFLCGAHTGSSSRMGDELQLVCEQRTPYILLWGRREIMCEKPVGAKSSTGMYSWTSEILRDQMIIARRRAQSDAAARSSSSLKKRTPAVVPPANDAVGGADAAADPPTANGSMHRVRHDPIVPES